MTVVNKKIALANQRRIAGFPAGVTANVNLTDQNLASTNSIFVAASNASARSKSVADYVCD